MCVCAIKHDREVPRVHELTYSVSSVAIVLPAVHPHGSTAITATTTTKHPNTTPLSVHASLPLLNILLSPCIVIMTCKLVHQVDVHRCCDLCIHFQHIRIFKTTHKLKQAEPRTLFSSIATSSSSKSHSQLPSRHSLSATAAPPMQ